MPEIVASVHIGTSGWHYKHWLGKFYPSDLPASEMLRVYSKTFSTVEINNTFYALPQQKTVEKWHTIAPDGFCFAVKASRYITHIKRLIDTGTALHNFFEMVTPLHEKTGPILFQFPPNWKINLERLKEFLRELASPYAYAFEFRHPSWYESEVYKTLAEHNIAFCFYDRELQETPLEITSDHLYIRLHGSGPQFGGNYTTGHLEVWAKRIQEWRTKVRDIWVYFNNDWQGFAINNALELQELLKLKRSSI